MRTQQNKRVRRPSPQASPRGLRHVGTRQPERIAHQTTRTEGLLLTMSDKKLIHKYLITFMKNRSLYLLIVDAYYISTMVVISTMFEVGTSCFKY